MPKHRRNCPCKVCCCSPSISGGGRGSRGKEGEEGPPGPRGDTGSEGPQGEPGQSIITNFSNFYRGEAQNVLPGGDVQFTSDGPSNGVII